MHQELTEKYGVSVLYKELPNSVYGFFTAIKAKKYIVVNENLNKHFADFCSIALLYFFLNGETVNLLTENFLNDIQQLQAIEFAKEYFLKLG